MQRTAKKLTIRVGEDGYPIELTDSAVVAVQEEAAGKAVNVLLSIPDLDSGVGLLDMDLAALLELRGNLGAVTDALDVLIECRPLDELDVEDDG